MLELNCPGHCGCGPLSSYHTKPLHKHHASIYKCPYVSANIRTKVVPRVTFTSPEVASVGMTEAEALAAGHEVSNNRISTEYLQNIYKCLRISTNVYEYLQMSTNLYTYLGLSLSPPTTTSAQDIYKYLPKISTKYLELLAHP